MNVVIGATYRHVKRGTHYTVIGRAKMQISSDTMNKVIGADTAYIPIAAAEKMEKIAYIIYEATEDGTLWVRPETEFCDGRFTRED